MNNNDSDGDGQTSCQGDCDDFDPRNSLDVDGDGISSCGEIAMTKIQISFMIRISIKTDLLCVDDCDDNNMF